MVTREEVIWIYRILLCRDPESEHLVSCYQKDFDNISDMRSHILRSDEFRQRENVVFKPKIGGAVATRDEIVSTLQYKIGNNFGLAIDVSNDSEISADFHDFILRMAATKEINIALFLGDSPIAAALVRLMRAMQRPPVAILQLMPSDVPGFKTEVQTNSIEAASLFAQMQVSLDVFTSIVMDIPSRVDFLYIANVHSAAEGLGRFYGHLEETGVCIVERRLSESASDRVPIAQFAAAYSRDVIDYSRFYVVSKSYWYAGIKRITSDQPAAIKAKRNKLALAAIVKNEAACIHTMLESVRHIVDFISIVDTGSTDRTKEIVAEWMGKSGINHRLQEEEFVNFSQARNTALRAVPADIEWILMLDGDEFLEVSDAAKLLDLLVTDEEGWAIPRYNYTDQSRSMPHQVYPDRQKRLFRNRAERPHLFGGAVHEVLKGFPAWALVPPNRTGLGGDEGGPHIHHMGLAISYERWLEKDRFYKSLGAK